MIRFCDFTRRYKPYEAEIQRAISRVLKRGYYILGPELEAFEGRFARYLGAGHLIGVNSGTDALFLALKAQGIGPRDQVITVANSAVATACAIRMSGATPVFVDVRSDSQTLDFTLLERAFGRKTRVIWNRDLQV